MGRLLEAARGWERAFEKIDEESGETKWTRPEFPRRFFPPGTVSCQMPGDDAFGSRPNAKKLDPPAP